MEAHPYRGSRKHVLDWAESASFLDELRDMLKPAPVPFPPGSQFMPRGRALPDEARLERFGPQLWPGHPAWGALRDWWLRHKAGANTPNWDLAGACQIEGNRGFVLVEAKANWPELSTGGKSLGAGASPRGRENHAHIGRAIDQACAAWRGIDPTCMITRDSHYQLANRLAFAWKLASLGIPVTLLYLGFTGDAGIVDAGEPFADDDAWHRAFAAYSGPSIPPSLLDRRLEFDGVPLWLLSRSRPVLEASPPRSS